MKRPSLLAALSVLVALSSAVAAPFVFPAAWFDDLGQAKRGGELRDYNPYDFKTFNPFITAEGGNIPARLSGGVGLYLQNPQDDSYLPWMADGKPTISNDGKRFVVKIRPGMKFSDGTPITAQDFVTTIKIHADDKVGSNLRDFFWQGDKRIEVQALNTLTLQFDFPKVSAGAYQRMSVTPWPDKIFGPVYAKEGAEGIRKMWGLNTPPAQIVSPGPWVLTSYAPGEKAVLKRNPNFGEWNRDSRGLALPYLNGYTVRIIKDQNASLGAYLAGQIDTFLPSKADDLAAIKKAIDEKRLNATLLANISPHTSSSWITFNWNRASDPAKQALFRDEKFRHAMSHLANRAAMVQLGMGGVGNEVYTSVYPIFKRYQFASTPKYAYNPAQATKLLAELGYARKNADGWLVNADGKVLEFDMMTDASNNVHTKLGQIFTDEAKKAGVKVNYKAVDFNTLVTQLLNASPDRKFDAILLNIGGGDNFWPFLRNQVPCGATLHAWNRLPDSGCISQAEKDIERLYDQGDQTLDSEARRKIGEQLARIESEQQAMIYLIGPNYHATWNNRLGGFYRKNLIDGQYQAGPFSFITNYVK